MQRATTGLLGLAMLGAFPLAVAAAEGPAERASDDRWLPWIGCWEAAPESGDTEADDLVVCLRYLDDADGVELLTYQNNELVSVEEIYADGLPALIEEGGCTGERFAEWSGDGQRVFLTSEMRCGEGVTRTTRGVMSFLPDGRRWVEIHGVEAGGQAPFVGLRQFVPASGATVADLGIERPEAEIGLAVRTARSQAAGHLDADGLVETVEAVGPSVTAALLVERGEPFGLDARSARSLAERGVPSEVLDVMVALDHPDRFEVGGDARQLRAEVREPAARPAAAERSAAPWPLTSPRYATTWRLYGRYGYDPFFYDPFFYDPFYSRRFGAGYYRPPPVIFVGAPEVRDRTVVDPQRGYSSDQTTGRRAVPSSSPSSGPSPARTPGTARSPDTRSGGSSGTTTRVRPQGGYSGGSDTGRQARPRDNDD